MQEPVAMDCASQLRAALEDVAGATWCPALHFTKLEEAKEALQWIVDVPLRCRTVNVNNQLGEVQMKR